MTKVKSTLEQSEPEPTIKLETISRKENVIKEENKQEEITEEEEEEVKNPYIPKDKKFDNFMKKHKIK